MPEQRSHIFINFLIRAILGFAIIFFVNQLLDYNGISLSVGMNPVTFVTSGIFGVPGVALLYCVTFYQSM